jgi:hypothetical protein
MYTNVTFRSRTATRACWKMSVLVTKCTLVMGKIVACVTTLVTHCEKIKIGALSRVHVQGHALISLDCLVLNVEELGSSLTFRSLMSAIVDVPHR